jgi:NADPH:quinone reductase-like Zn-dependent oxidoreductase
MSTNPFGTTAGDHRTGTGTMRAAVRRAYGSVDELRVELVERPRPAADEVLLRTRAAGLDRGAWHLMTGKPYLLRLVYGLRRPRNPVLGTEVAGTVVAVGPAVTRFSVGDEVYGFSKGSFAEYAVAKESQLSPKPGAVSFEQAAVVPVSAATALQALVDVGRVQPGQSVLVIGASGGVGSYAVQLAKALGAEVTAVASAAKLELVRSLGADRVIDYARTDFAATGQRYDLILDIGGNPALHRLRRALTPTGTAVLVGGEEGDSLTGGLGRTLRARMVSMFVSHRLTNFIAKQRSSDLETLTELIETGRLRPVVDTTYPLDRVTEAMRQLEGGKVRSKVAIVA